MEESCFSLATERDGSTVCLRLAGDFDRAAIREVEEAIETARRLPLEQLVFDLSALTFLDVAGLRTLLRAHRRAREDEMAVTVIRPRGLANRVFTLTRAGEILSMSDR